MSPFIHKCRPCQRKQFPLEHSSSMSVADRLSVRNLALLLRWLVAGANLRANYFSRDDDLNAPVLLSASCSVITCNLIRLPVSDGGNRGWVNPLVYEICPDRGSPILRECLIVCIASNAVRVPFNLQLQPRMSDNDAG